MVPSNLRAALLAVTFGSLLVCSSVVTGAAVASQQPTLEQPAQTTQPPADANNSSAPDDDAVVETFRDRFTSIETVVMTIETDIQVNDNRSMSTEQRLWVDYENDRVRSEIDFNGTETVTVRNESKTVMYNAEENTVSTFNNTGSVGSPNMIRGILNNSELTYEATERLNGEQTYRVSVTPTDANAMARFDSVEATLWIDAETYFPEKFHAVTDSDDSGYEMTTRFRNVTLDEAIPDSRFEIDVPDDAEKPDYASNIETYDSLTAVEESTNLTVPNPEVPEAYNFEEGTVFNGSDYRSVSLRYESDDGETIRVSARGATEYDYDEQDSFETVAVSGHYAYYTEFDYDGNTTSSLVLPCEDTTYSVHGGLSKSGTIEIAESLDCE